MLDEARERCGGGTALMPMNALALAENGSPRTS
jgi:hypothetical protein